MIIDYLNDYRNPRAIARDDSESAASSPDREPPYRPDRDDGERSLPLAEISDIVVFLNASVYCLRRRCGGGVGARRGGARRPRGARDLPAHRQQRQGAQRRARRVPGGMRDLL